METKEKFYLVAEIYLFPEGYVEEEKWETDKDHTMTKLIRSDWIDIKNEFGSYSPRLVKVFPNGKRETL